MDWSRGAGNGMAGWVGFFYLRTGSGGTSGTGRGKDSWGLMDRELSTGHGELQLGGLGVDNTQI